MIDNLTSLQMVITYDANPLELNFINYNNFVLTFSKVQKWHKV
jgi:hypothetical protein